MVLIGIFGAGGFAREVMPVARHAAESAFGRQPYEVVFVVGTPGEHTNVNGHRVLSEDEFFAAGALRKLFNVAIADSRLRRRLAEDALHRGVEPFECRAANVVTLDGNLIGEGAILAPSVIITSNAKIGRFFHANLASYVAHDCTIGDWVTFAPMVHCNGNVVVHDHAYVGTGAIIRDGKPGAPLVIGKGAVVGMGAVVTKDVPPGATVVGNPARPLASRR